MPHVIVKLRAGRPEELKAELAARLARIVADVVRCPDSAISVGIQDIEAADWVEQVYKPDIMGKSATLYKRPGYDPL
jgi:4-oxalocrotonate tautomerase